MNLQIKFIASLMACLVVPMNLSAQSQPQRKPITHEALWMMKRVGSPVVSPDGKWVVYSLLEPSYETDKSVSDLWLVSADGLKAPRRLTNTKAPEGDVAWSPDSSSIAFATKRETDDVDQIYILNLA
jgi:Tol biopolymer transport system component